MCYSEDDVYWRCDESLASQDQSQLDKEKKGREKSAGIIK